jgi:hypothetical protein
VGGKFDRLSYIVLFALLPTVQKFWKISDASPKPKPATGGTFTNHCCQQAQLAQMHDMESRGFPATHPFRFFQKFLNSL